MKTTRILLFTATLLLFPWCATALFSQQNDPAEPVKTITITKRTVDADGSETIETIVKKGKAAENFDVDKYLAENRDEKMQVQVQIMDGNEDGEERVIVVKGTKGPKGPKGSKGSKGSKNDDSDEMSDDDDDDEMSYSYGGYGCSDAGAFLGVDEDSDEDADQPGLVINVVRGTAADRAGLRDNDKIMKINDAPINRWSDLTKFVNAAKPGDKVRIAYERNGKAASTEATLTKRGEVDCNVKCEPKGFLGVSDMEEEDEQDEPGVAVSITAGGAADKAGLKKGDVIFQLDDTKVDDFEDISDFMAYTKPGEKVRIVYERNGQRNNVEATFGEQKNTWEGSDMTWNTYDWNSKNWDMSGALNQLNNTFNVRQKDACLGVYTSADGTGDTQGARISDFTAESAARDVNMVAGDVITAVNGKRVKSHDDVWNEISQYKIGDKVKVEYLREGKALTVDVTLKACQDNSSRVEILDGDGQLLRNFQSCNWSKDDQRRLRERSIITIRKGEGDAPKVNEAPNAAPPMQDRRLNLVNFRAFPNPTQGQITVEFNSEALPTTVSLFDLSGRQLFREELNAFGGQYSQQFDLTEYAKGAIVIHIQQGEKVFTEQVVVN